MDRSCCLIAARALPAVIVLVTAFFRGNSLPAQTPPARDANLLDQARRISEVAAQKVEADLRAGLREVERLTSSDPAKALQRLQLLLTRLEDDTALSDARRETLKRMVKDRIRVATAAAKDAVRQTNERADKQAKTADFRAAVEPQLTSQETILQLREGIQQWQRDRNHPAAQTAADRTKSTADRVAENRQLQSARERRTNDV